jgi:hypothetical protein
MCVCGCRCVWVSLFGCVFYVFLCGCICVCVGARVCVCTCGCVCECMYVGLCVWVYV